MTTACISSPCNLTPDLWSCCDRSCSAPKAERSTNNRCSCERHCGAYRDKYVLDNELNDISVLMQLWCSFILTHELNWRVLMLIDVERTAEMAGKSCDCRLTTVRHCRSRNGLCKHGVMMIRPRLRLLTHSLTHSYEPTAGSEFRVATP